MFFLLLLPGYLLFYISSPEAYEGGGVYKEVYELDDAYISDLTKRLSAESCETPFGLEFGVPSRFCWGDLVISYYVGAFLIPLMMFATIRLSRWIPSLREGILRYCPLIIAILLFIWFLWRGSILGVIFVLAILAVPIDISIRKSKSTSVALFSMLVMYILLSLYRISVIGGFSGTCISQCLGNLLQLRIGRVVTCLFQYKTESSFWFLAHIETILAMSFLLLAFPLLTYIRYSESRVGGHTTPGDKQSERERFGNLSKLSTAFKRFLNFWWLTYRQVIIRARGYIIISFTIGLILTLFIAILPFFRTWLHQQINIGIDDLSDLFQNVDVLFGSFILWGLPMAGFVISPEEIINISVGPTLRRILVKNRRKIVIIGSGRLAKALLHNMRERYGFWNGTEVLFEDEMLRVHKIMVLIDYDEFIAHKIYEDEVFGRIGIYVVGDSAIICLLGERESGSPDFKLKDSKEKLHILNKFTDYFEIVVIASRSPRVQNGIYKMLREGEYFRGKYGMIIMSVEQNSQLKFLFPSKMERRHGGEEDVRIFPVNYNLQMGESFLHKALSLLPERDGKVLLIGDPYFAGYLARGLLIGYWKMYHQPLEICLVSKGPYYHMISKEVDGTAENLPFNRVLELGSIIRNSVEKEGLGRVFFFPVRDYPYSLLKEALCRENWRPSLVIVLGDPNKLVTAYSIASNLIHIMKVEGLSTPVILEVVDKGGMRIVRKIVKLLEERANTHLDPFFLQVDPYQEPVKPMVTVMDAMSPEDPKKKRLFLANLCLRDTPGALFNALSKMVNGEEVKEGDSTANLRLVRFYTCNCDKERAKRGEVRYVLEAFLEFGMKGGDRGHVVIDELVEPEERSLVEKLSAAGGGEGCPLDITCPLTASYQNASRMTLEDIGRAGTQVERYYIFVCMRDNYLLEILDAIKRSGNAGELKENVRKIIREKAETGRKEPAKRDVEILYLQEHLCLSKNTLIEIYGEILAEPRIPHIKHGDVSFFGDLGGDLGGPADGLDRKDIGCPIRQSLKNIDTDVLFYGKRIPLHPTSQAN